MLGKQFHVQSLGWVFFRLQNGSNDTCFGVLNGLLMRSSVGVSGKTEGVLVLFFPQV